MKYKNMKKSHKCLLFSIDIKNILWKGEINIIGLIIKNLRKKYGLTQNDLSEMIFYSKESISKWERGISTPPIEALFLISEKLKYPMKNFFITKDNQKFKDEIFDKAIKLLKKDIDISISNISIYNNISINLIMNVFHNDDDLLKYIISKFEYSIERKISSLNFEKYGPYNILMNKIPKIIFKYRKSIYLFYNSSNISDSWKKYIINKYYLLYIDKYKTKEDKAYLIINILISIIEYCFKNKNFEINIYKELVNKSLKNLIK